MSKCELLAGRTQIAPLAIDFRQVEKEAAVTITAAIHDSKHGQAVKDSVFAARDRGMFVRGPGLGDEEWRQ